MKKTHQAKVLVISCIDFRFITIIRNYLIDQGLGGKYDLITLPGASLNLEDATSSIATSITLHNPDEIYIFDHEDCGAYGEDNSNEKHVENLDKAKKYLSNKYPGRLIKVFIAYFNEIKEI